MDHPFRNAAIGGFNRQDVLTYLEDTAKKAAQQQQELQQQLDQVQGTVSQQSAQLSEQEERINGLDQDNASLRAQLEQANVELSLSRTESSQRANQLDALNRDLTQWKEKATALEPDATAYAAIKERTAGVELEAHHRAQTIQSQAEQDAKNLRHQMQQWIARVEREYDTLRTDVETTVSHAADQLQRAETNLAQVAALMGEQDIALEALTQAYAKTDQTKVAAPMPISEEE